MSKNIPKKVQESVADKLVTGCDHEQLGETIISTEGQTATAKYC